MRNNKKIRHSFCTSVSIAHTRRAIERVGAKVNGVVQAVIVLTVQRSKVLDLTLLHFIAKKKKNAAERKEEIMLSSVSCPPIYVLHRNSCMKVILRFNPKR